LAKKTSLQVNKVRGRVQVRLYIYSEDINNFRRHRPALSPVVRAIS